MTDRAKLITALKDYHSDYTAEIEFKKQFLKLLDHPRAFFRDHLPGHITGSAWIIDHSGQFTLLTHHAKLNRWLQPGGHADGEENVVNVAFREATEETGLTSLKLALHSIFDIDIHPIPARPEFPQHDHYDIRFLFQASRDDDFQITEESHDLAWKKISDLPELTGNNASILRMAEKVKRLF